LRFYEVSQQWNAYLDRLNRQRIEEQHAAYEKQEAAKTQAEGAAAK
jgi:hypothetical protein